MVTLWQPYAALAEVIKDIRPGRLGVAGGQGPLGPSDAVNLETNDDPKPIVRLVDERRAVVGRDDVGHDGKAQARTGLAAGLDRPIEAIEHQLSICLADARSAITDLHPAAVHAEIDLGSGFAELHRVVHQVLKRPLDQRSMAV